MNPAVSILERPFYQDGQHLLVTTYSGSNKVVFIINMENCNVLWYSKPFVGNVALKENTLQLDNKTIKLNSNCIPHVEKNYFFKMIVFCRGAACRAHA